MSATFVLEKNLTTLPADVVAAAGIHPMDQVDWRFEDGEIRGRKLQPAPETETLDEMPETMGKISNTSIREAVRAGRR